MSEIARKLTCAAMAFYEYKADDGAILREAANRIKELEYALSRQIRNMELALCSRDSDEQTDQCWNEIEQDRKLL